MVNITLIVNCANCDAEIKKGSVHLSDSSTTIEVSVYEFSQTSWVCDECGHTTIIGDIDAIDLEEL